MEVNIGDDLRSSMLDLVPHRPTGHSSTEMWSTVRASTVQHWRLFHHLFFSHFNYGNTIKWTFHLLFFCLFIWIHPLSTRIKFNTVKHEHWWTEQRELAIISFHWLVCWFAHVADVTDCNENPFTPFTMAKGNNGIYIFTFLIVRMDYLFDAPKCRSQRHLN